MKKILSLIISGALVVSGYSQTRNVLVGTNNAVVQPTNFWSADASNARSGLGLGTSATNPASAFQPSSATLSNLASSNGGALTNLRATNIVGLIPTSNIPSIVLTSIGTISIVQGGTGATNAANARQNLGSTTVGDAVFVATNAEAARTAIGALANNGDATNLTNFPTSLLRSNGSAIGLTNFPSSLLTINGNAAFLTNITAANIAGTVALASNVTGTIAISNGGSGATTAGGARTNLGLGTTNDVQFGRVFVNGVLDVYSGISSAVEVFKPILIADRDSTNAVFQFEVGSDAAIARTNLGLPLAALTNTNNANFQAAVFNTNTTPVGSAFNNIVAWMEVNVFTNGSNTSFRIPLFK